jgi:hypothetical protein
VFLTTKFYFKNTSSVIFAFFLVRNIRLKRFMRGNLPGEGYWVILIIEGIKTPKAPQALPGG